MRQEREERDDSLSLAMEQRIDQVCMRFEAGWQAGATPRLEDFLGEAAGAERHELLRELLRVELDWRQQRGERPSLADYLARFPNDALLLREVLASRVERPSSPSGIETRDTAGGARSSGATEAVPAVPGYEVGRLLGRGGMGVVYEAVQVRAGRRVALKLLRGGAGAEPEERERFRREVEAAAGLRHPGIVQVYEVGDHDGVPWFSMELCEAGSLADYLRTGPLPPADAAALVQALAHAMHQAHQAGILHRDLKPANILFSPAGATTGTAADEERPALSTLAAKVADFGLARKRDTGGHTQTGVVVGTPSYMAPEQASGRNRELGPACDTYALGAILYECLTGRPPFQAATALDTLLQVISDEPVPPARLNAKVPRDLETICLKCLHEEPSKRYASALELAEDLRRFLAGEPIVARPAGRVERLLKWARRRPTLAAVYALLVLVLGLGAVGGGAVWLWREALHQKEGAEKAQKQAEESERAELFQRQRAEFLVYVLHLREAQAEIQRGQLDKAEAVLRQCEPTLCSWEHAYLLRQTQRCIWTGRHTGYVSSVAFSADGKRIVSGSGDRTVRAWDAQTGQEVLKGAGGDLIMAFSVDGKRIVSGRGGTEQGNAGPGEVKVWDAHTGQEALTFRHTCPVTSVAFSADGKRFFSGSGDGVKVWDATPRSGVTDAARAAPP